MELGKIRNLIDLDEFFIYEFFGLLPLSLFFPVVSILSYFFVSSAL